MGDLTELSRNVSYLEVITIAKLEIPTCLWVMTLETDNLLPQLSILEFTIADK